MTLTEIGFLIKEISSVDPRFGMPNEDKAKAWQKAINQHIPLNVAIDFVAKHYSLSEKTLMPSDINNYYHGEKKNQVFEAAPQVSGNLQWRKMVALDLEAKRKLEGDERYTKGGIPWKYPMGSGGYATEARNKGITLKGDSPIQEMGKSV